MREHSYGNLRSVLREHRLRNGELAVVLGVTRSAISNKINGLRPWLASEAIAVTEFLRQWDPELTVESLFAEAPSTPASEAA